MANQITDNRTSVTTAESTTGFEDISGVADGTLDNEIFIQGSGSIGEDIGNSVKAILYNTGSTQSWAGYTAYVWINCGIVGVLATKANGGMRIRFTGSTVTNWFEVYVAGADDWPAAVGGGWVQFVVDIDEARSTAVTNGWTNGTVPTANQIQRIGWAGVTNGTMPRKISNTWIDEIAVLPASTPGIIVEGRNGGSTDWDSADIASTLGVGVGTFLVGAGGSYKINTPIQFGINDTSTHGFTDSNTIWLWDDQEFVPDDFYQISALGNSGGTTSVTFGIKTGTGATATGAQGLTVSAATAGARWAVDLDDPNVDTINFNGCSFQHSGDFQLDDPSVELIDTLLIDGQAAQVTDSYQNRTKVIQPAVATGVAAFTTDDLADLHAVSFESTGVGHAVDLGNVTSSATMGWDCFDTGYAAQGGTAGNRTLLVNVSSGETLTINVAAGASTPTYNNTGAGTVSVVAGQVTTTVTVVDIDTGAAIENANVYVLADAGGPLTEGTVIIDTSTLTDVDGEVSDTRALASDQPITGRVRRASPGYGTLYKTSPIAGTISSANGVAITVQMIKDE